MAANRPRPIESADGHDTDPNIQIPPIDPTQPSPAAAAAATSAPVESTTPPAASQNEKSQKVRATLNEGIRSKITLVLAFLAVFGGGAVVGPKILHCNACAGSGSPTAPDGGGNEVFEKEINVTVGARVLNWKDLVIEPRVSGFSILVSGTGKRLSGGLSMAYPHQVLITTASGKQYRPKEPIYAYADGRVSVTTIEAVLVEPDAGQ